MSFARNLTMGLSALALTAVAIPTAAAAQDRPLGVIQCDAPGNRQEIGAGIGAVLGGLLGSQISDNERTLGAVAGAAVGAGAGSYIGCNQQRARQDARGGDYRATSNLRIRSGPGTSYRQVGSLSAGQPFSAIGSQGEWVQIAGGGWVNAHYVTTN